MSELTLLAVGDVAARRADLASMFARVAPALRQGDFVFGQLEAPISDRGARNPEAKLAMRCEPAMARAAADAGFGVMSCAGNHCLDFGPEALIDTLVHGEAAGLALCGAGPDLDSARQPAILERGGVRLGVVAVSSILPAGYDAGAHRAGCAPMRAFTHYEMIEPDQPGTPPRVHTFPHRGDLARLAEDIALARQAADVVALSIHWGIHLVPADIADYQRDVAAAAIQAGCDVVLGHHPHILKGVEFIAGKPVFYSLGNFAIEQPQAFDPAIMTTASFRNLMALNPHFSVESAYVLPPETRFTMIARAVIRSGTIVEVGFQPAFIEDDSAPTPLTADDPRFAAMVDYLRDITARAGLATDYLVEGDLVRVVPRP
jgi:poly-gamma-glutamate capsule biosynthesis protein CapA/YwtB (metallophosphatase superfamily)